MPNFEFKFDAPLAGNPWFPVFREGGIEEQLYSRDFSLGAGPVSGSAA
jgi:hypothetical protein